MPSQCPASVDVPFDRMPDSPILYAPLVEIVHISIYALIEPHLRGHVAGRCLYAESGIVMAEYVTLYALPGSGVFLDGQTEQATRHVKCPECGTLYSTNTDGRYAVHAKDVAEVRASLLNRHDALIVDAEILSRVRALDFRGLRARRMPIIE